MPYRPKKAIQRKNDHGLTEEQTEFLMQGFTMNTLCGDPPPFDPDSDDAERAWLKHRDYLMALMPPGFRPWAWWNWECPKFERKLLSGDPDFDHSMTYATHNGIFFCKDGKNRTEKDLPVYESDYQLLTRLKLLSDEEAEAYEQAQADERERRKKIIQFPIETEEDL